MLKSLSARAHRSAAITVSAALALSALVGVMSAAPASATTQSFSAIVPVPAAPAATTSVSGSGDGWSLSFYNPSGGERVYTVFHNPANSLNISCNVVSTGADCWSAYDGGAGYITFTYAGHALYVSPNHPGNWMDQNTGYLYVWAVDPSSNTTGIAVVNVGTAADPGTTVTSWIPMSAAGDGSSASTQANGLATPAFIGSKWYEYNAAPTAANSRMLCFDTSTKTACTSSTTAILGTASSSALTTMGAIDNKLLLLDASKNVSCYDPSTDSLCFNQFSLGYTAGAPIPSLTTAGLVNGFCFLGGGTNAKCYTFPGPNQTPQTLTEPAALATTFSGAGYTRALNVVIGTRVYVPSSTNSYTVNSALCFDFKTGTACANFPITFSNMTRLYTLNQDPFNQSCIWASADSGTRMQSFDAITGGTCGTRRVQTVSVIPDLTCFSNSNPALTFTSLTLSTSGGSNYGGTINVANEAGAVVDTMTVSTAGAVSPLDTLTAQSHGATPSLVLNATSNGTLITAALTLTFSWTGSSSCSPAPAYAAPKSMSLSGGQGGNQSGSAIAETVTAGTAIVGETPTVSGLTSGVTVTSYSLDTSTAGAGVPDLSFDTSTGVLSGTPPTAGGPWTYTITAHLSDNTTLTSTYTLTVTNPVPAITLGGGLGGNQTGNSIAETVTVQTPIVGETPTVTNATVDTATGFTLDACTTQSPCPPTWMTFDTATGVISGTPTDTQTAVDYTITAHLVGGNTLSSHYTLTVLSPPTIVLNSGSQSGSAVAETVTVNHAVTGETATLTNVSSCTVSPALPSGVTLNSTTCAISGSPASVQSAQIYTITAHGTYGGSATASYTLTVLDGPSLSLTGGTSGNQAGNAIAETVTVNSPINGASATPASLPSGVTVTEYSLTVPSGASPLHIDTVTGDVTGTPSTVGGPWAYTITAHLSDNSTLASTYTLTVVPVATHTITTNTTGSGTATLSSAGPYAPGTVVTATATPTGGWHFTSWTCTPAPSSSTSNPLSITVGSSDISCTANFDRNYVAPPVVTPPAPPAPPAVVQSNTDPSPIKLDPSSTIATDPGPITLPQTPAGSNLIVDPTRLPQTPGIETAKLTDGKVTYTAKPGFSGKTNVPLLYTAPDGKQTVVLVPVTVNPAPPINSTYTPQAANKSTLGWAPSPNAIGYTLIIDGKVVCTTTTATSCKLPRILGPNHTIQVQAMGNDGTISTQTLSAYAPKKFIPLVTVHFAVDKWNLDTAALKALRKFVTLMKREGFTKILVQAYTDGQGGANNATHLSSQRATQVATFLTKAGLKVSISKKAGANKNPVASNKTKQGQAANRRATGSVM